MAQPTAFRTYEAAPPLSAVQAYPQAKKLQERDTESVGTVTMHVHKTHMCIHATGT